MRGLNLILKLDGYRWALKLPRYVLIRTLFSQDSLREKDFHKKRKLQSIALAGDSTVESVESVLSEMEELETLNRMNLKIKELNWLGYFRAGPELFSLCRLIRPSIVVETGVGSGYSSTYILQALELNQHGRLISIDLPNADQAWSLPNGLYSGFLVPENLKKRWDLVFGDTMQVLPSILSRLGTIDIFFHDSEHTYNTMMFEFESCWQNLKHGGVLMSDDAIWNTAMLDFAKKRAHRHIGFIYHNGGSFPVAYIKK